MKFGHTPNTNGNWHLLRDHILGVTERSQQFAARFGAGDFGLWAGLLHDLGKYTPEFQQYLQDCYVAKQNNTTPPVPGSAPHKQHGAVFAGRFYPLLTPIILGHHGEIPSRATVRGIVQEYRNNDLTGLHLMAAEDCPELLPLPEPQTLTTKLVNDALSADMFIRMVYSCLVDADSLDTEAHFSPDNSTVRQRQGKSLGELCNLLREDQVRLQASVRNSLLNDLRREVYDACVEAASGPPGIYRLTVPTGGGKTRSSLAFALEHACKNDLDRVIYGIPYTSIVDQTADTFEKIFGPESVLEHHSAIEPENPYGQDEFYRRLACQNWDAPLIVTTTVQLFESLWGNRPGRCRKVHRLAHAVLVLDEVQTLPTQILIPLIDGLRHLVEQYGTTVVLCTATQPAFDTEVLRMTGLNNVQEIFPEAERLFAQLRRVTYDLSPIQGEPWSWEEIAARMRLEPSCLTILNTRKDALSVLNALNDPDALHLSTLLCGRHRRDTLAEVRRRLQAGIPCRLVATQVVECGCDLDFPLVLRAIGPLDRIVQAAGRCNREGLRPAATSQVVVFYPIKGGNPKGPYAAGLNVADKFLRRNVDLNDPTVYERFFRDFYESVSLDGENVQRLRSEFDFPEVASKMRLIKEDTVSLLVRYEPALSELEALIAIIRLRRKMDALIWRQLQPFLISMPKWEFEKFSRQNLVREIEPNSGLYLWEGQYNVISGIVAEYRDPTDLIV